MKKVLFKTVLVLLCATATMATYAKNKPFVSWKKTPTIAQQLAFVPTAVTNKSSGASEGDATIYGTAQAYRDVWGATLYNEVATATLDRFSTGPSIGGERNHGIDEDGNVTEAPLLDAGVECVWFTRPNGQKIAITKLGENLCFNALSPGQLTKSDPSTPPPPPPPAPGTNTITQTVNTGKGEMTAMEYLGAAFISQNQQLGNMQAGINMFKDGAYFAKSLGCCNGGGSGMSGMSAGFSMPAQPSVMYLAQEPTFGQTWFGQYSAHTLAEITAGGVNRLLYGNGNNVVYTTGSNNWVNPGVTSGPWAGGTTLTSQGPLPDNRFLNVANPGIIRDPRLSNQF